MDSDTAEEPGGLERGIQGATVATGVAGAEQTTWTGHRYNQISSSHVEPEFTALGETSRECSHFGEAVIPSATVEHGLITEIHTCKGRGMPLEGWVTTAQEAQHPGKSEESSAQQTSFTKLSAETEVESGGNGTRLMADTSISDRDEEFMGDVIPTLSRSRETE